MDHEILKAVAEQLNLYRLAEDRYPEMPIGEVGQCGCMGPLPECHCMKRKRLITEFLRAIGEEE